MRVNSGLVFYLFDCLFPTFVDAVPPHTFVYPTRLPPPPVVATEERGGSPGVQGSSPRGGSDHCGRRRQTVALYLVNEKFNLRRNDSLYKEEMFLYLHFKNIPFPSREPLNVPSPPAQAPRLTSGSTSKVRPSFVDEGRGALCSAPVAHEPPTLTATGGRPQRTPCPIHPTHRHASGRDYPPTRQSDVNW